MTSKTVRSNYNSVGATVMEMMYATDYLSLGGVDSTDRLAQAAGINADDLTLDVGCGIGGPALRLFDKCGCDVIGIDLIASNIEQARQRSLTRQRSITPQTNTIEFLQADALNLPFNDCYFSAVFGQDAWLHIPSKQTFINQVFRVLQSGGRIAFTDWVLANGTPPAASLEIREVAASPEMAQPQEYETLLGNAGFIHTQQTDLSETFTAQYRQIMRKLAELEDEISVRFSQDIYQIVAEKHGLVMEAFASNLLQGVMFIAEKPA